MLNKIKGLFKVQLEDDDLLLGLMALVQVFKSPTKTVLDSFTLDKAILVLMDNL